MESVPEIFITEKYCFRVMYWEGQFIEMFDTSGK